MLQFFDYEVLRIIWWILLGVLLIGFAIMDGFDLGIAILLPFIAKNDIEKRILLNSIGPVWEGNQVWLILGAGAIFAAWPFVYAVSFSGFYFAMLIILLALILRPVGFDYREKIKHKIWKNIWDICIFISGLVPALVFGVAVGNAIKGIPFSFNSFMMIENKINFFALFSPFTIICGLLSLLILVNQGVCYLAIKTEGEILLRVKKIINFSPLLAIGLFAIGGWMLNYIDCYQITDFAGKMTDSNPLRKTVITATGCWLDNYQKYPLIHIAPIIGFLGQLLIVFFIKYNQYGKAFIASSISIAGIIATVGLTMFPFILPSNLDPNSSLTVWDASSSKFTLMVMLIATIIFVPIIIAYTSWVYRILRGKVNEKDIKKDSNFLY